MRPRLEEWFLIQHGTALELPGYLVMLCLAIMAGCGVLLLYARHQNLHERAVYSFLILALPSLIIGGKLLYAVQFIACCAFLRSICAPTTETSSWAA